MNTVTKTQTPKKGNREIIGIELNPTVNVSPSVTSVDPESLVVPVADWPHFVRRAQVIMDCRAFHLDKVVHLWIPGSGWLFSI